MKTKKNDASKNGYEVGKPFEMEEGWWCDVLKNGWSVYTAGPAPIARDAKWMAEDWVNERTQLRR